MLFDKHIVEFGIILNVVRVWAIKIFRERHRQDFNIHLSLFKKLFHKWLNCVFSSFFTLLFSIHSISLSVWDRFIIYQFNKRSIYDYFKSGAIAGGVIGGILGLAIIVYIVHSACVKICKRQNHGQIMVYPQQSAANTSSST